MSSTVTCNPTTAASARSARLADRLMRGAQELVAFARGLSIADWRRATPGDGRAIGIVIHHVATIYPLDLHLARMVASGTRIVGITAATIDELNAAHAREHARATKAETLMLLAENSAVAADGVRRFSDVELDRAMPVSLYGDAELTCQFVIEDRALRHCYHHLARLRAALIDPFGTT